MNAVNRANNLTASRREDMTMGGTQEWAATALAARVARLERASRLLAGSLGTLIVGLAGLAGCCPTVPDLSAPTPADQPPPPPSVVAEPPGPPEPSNVPPVTKLEAKPAAPQPTSAADSPPTPSPRSPGLGDDAILRTNGGDDSPISLATSDEAWTAMSKAVAGGDQVGYAALVTSGDVLLIQTGTRAKVIEIGVFSRKVRITEGPNAGRGGWVAAEFVRPIYP